MRRSCNERYELSLSLSFSSPSLCTLETKSPQLHEAAVQTGLDLKFVQPKGSEIAENTEEIVCIMEGAWRGPIRDSLWYVCILSLSLFLSLLIPLSTAAYH